MPRGGMLMILRSETSSRGESIVRKYAMTSLTSLRSKNDWLPSGEDRAFVASLMGRVVEPGKFANWIAPPVMGINRQPVDFEYIRFN